MQASCRLGSSVLGKVRLAAVAIICEALLGLSVLTSHGVSQIRMQSGSSPSGAAVVNAAAAYGLSPRLPEMHPATFEMERADCGEADGSKSVSHGCGISPENVDADDDDDDEDQPGPITTNATSVSPSPTVSLQSAAIEQTHQGVGPAAELVESFDGLGVGFTGPQGTATTRNPSDNSLAVGPNHVVQIVNSRMAVFTKKGAMYDSTGKVLYGPVVTNAIFTGFGGQCEHRTSGDAVVRYDQLANRWLYVLPVFRRPENEPTGPYSMCYAVSQGADPHGPYYRYEFKRLLFPDYPRPAIWPDGYYVPTSVGDNIIQKQDCVVDRNKMLKGEAATEQCLLIDGAGFLNNADIDGQGVPAAGAPNIMMVLGGTQLRNQFEDDGVYFYKVHVDWNDPAKTSISGPEKIKVAPYHYLCNGQLTKCVPQPGTETRLDAQGDKLMQRLVYRKIGRQESIVGLHSVDTKAGGGGVRWYEFRLDRRHELKLYQQGTYAPDGRYRWMGSIDMDTNGNIGMGYSYGGAPDFAGQRFVARMAKDRKGEMTLHEVVLAEGSAAQTNTLRWEDYSTTAMDPTDDCTFWYVGDYLKVAGESYRTRIGAFRLPGCRAAEMGLVRDRQ